MKTRSFEDFLSDKCGSHTNNSLDGFDKWLENLDGEEYMNYAQEYGNEMLKLGELGEMVTEAREMPFFEEAVESFNLLKESLHLNKYPSE